jgi:N-carbamoyl-L-amino-acid hydrolase
MLTLQRLNAASAARFAALLDGIYEHSPWIAERTALRRPAAGFATLAELKHALASTVREAGRERQLALVRAHPELAAAVGQALTAESGREQRRAGLSQCTPSEHARLQELNAAYSARFGWPFILAVRGPRGLGLARAEIITSFERRLESHPQQEFAECLRQIDRIAELRLNDRFGYTPVLGQRVWDGAEDLAAYSDPGPREPGGLTVTYLGDAHRACAERLRSWMHEAGFDDTSVDAVGNVVGVYHGSDASAPRLLTGSHYDTVRNGGRYDGRLGILVPLQAVRELARAGRRLPFGIELVGFAEEEGQRWPVAFLGSSALVGRFDPAWLELQDGDGVRLQGAMVAAGLPATPEAIAALRRDPARYLGFVEVHIEQGPVLCEAGLPLGVVSSINGSLRYRGEVVGTASHAGTTPMDRRRDAACAVAELLLFVEKRAAVAPAAVHGNEARLAVSVGTVGMLEVPGGSVNVVPGRCRFSLDLRASTDHALDALAAEVSAELGRICAARGLGWRLERTLAARAAPSAPAWQQRWEAAVAALGLPLLRLASGAGHDAMKLHELMPQAMLFVRGGHAGISHNPLETITDDDAELAVAAMLLLLEGLARE